jgi:hypothetical protein
MIRLFLNVISKKALEICHFDPESGLDLRRAPNARKIVKLPVTIAY